MQAAAVRLSDSECCLSRGGELSAVSTPYDQRELISWAPVVPLPCPPHTQIMKSLSKEAPNAMLPWEASQRCWSCHFSPPHPPRFQGSGQMPSPPSRFPRSQTPCFFMLDSLWRQTGSNSQPLSAFFVASEHRSGSSVPCPHPSPTLGRSVLLRKRIRVFSPNWNEFLCVFIKFSSS